MKKILPTLLILLLIAPISQATDDWLMGIGMHKGVWMRCQDATSHWTIKDKTGYLLTLNQIEGNNQESPVLYLRNTVLWDGALIDGIVRYSINKSSSALSGLYLGFGPRAKTDWGSFYLNLGGVLASGTFNAIVDQAPLTPGEGAPKQGDSVAISFLDLAPAMEGGLDFELGKVALNISYSLIGQKKLDNYRYTYQKEPIELIKLDNNLAPVMIGGSFLSCSILYKF